MKKLITNKKEVSDELKEFSISRKVISELGEPIIFDRGDVFCVLKENEKCIAFGAINAKKNFLKYMYVRESHRGKGLFKEVYLELEKLCSDKIKTVSTNNALPIYQKYGFTITKSYVNYHNLIKEL